ncbi:MAG: STAS domain-containing protein [Ramlibacter sp.]
MPLKEETTGLLSKVVKFVKNPTTNWADLDQQETDRESTYSKQMLKEMIERKRRNDFVRKREFDMLRKMRRSEVMAGHDTSARPSFFQSSLPSKPDDRASTLKKIDEIEAQMSMQWWKTKHGDSSTRGSASFPMSSHMPPDSGGAQGSPAAGPKGYHPTGSAPAVSDEDRNEPSEPAMLQSMPDSFPPSSAPVPLQSRPGSAPGRIDNDGGIPRHGGIARPSTPVVQPPSRSISAVTPAHPVTEPGSSTGFSASKLFAIDVEEFAHDPELEEAAIRFANGDDAGAEAGLREVLGPNGSRANHDETWLTLFDLYRAIGQQERFETAAIDFAGRFGRSAPQWVSIPDAVGRMHGKPAQAAPAGGAQQAPNWTSPATLGSQTVVAMTVALGKATPPWRLSWVKLSAIEEGAVESLTRVFTQWASQSVQLRFMGTDVLEQVLKNATPSGDRSVNPAWWKLRMEVLRVMHRPDEFELVALDYCVTYEVSPPSWDSARCDYKSLQADGSYVAGHTIVGEAFRDSLSTGMSVGGYSDTHAASLSQPMSNIATVELAGQILGDSGDVLDLLDDKLMGADIMVISCARLIRIDFSSAGTLLNWVSTRQAEGRQVQFVDVHRLVAAFFNVIGVSEHARVIARTD